MGMFHYPPFLCRFRRFAVVGLMTNNEGDSTPSQLRGCGSYDQYHVIISPQMIITNY